MNEKLGVRRKNERWRFEPLFVAAFSAIDLCYIQELLGHKSSKTTTHVTTSAKGKIKSPLDNLELNNE